MGPLAMRQLAYSLLLFCVLAAGCSSVPINKARDAYWRGDYEEAKTLLDSSDIASRNRLLALMEKGSILHESGDYEGSSQALLAAAKLLESTDFVSVGKTVAASTVNDNVKTYRGEYAERLWIHSWQIMNFLLLGKNESAAVEARQALRIWDAHEDALAQDYVSRALLGVAFDSVGLFNSALIEYRKLQKLLPSNPQIEQLVADRAVRSGVATTEQRKQYSGRHKTHGELIVFISNGRIPRKQSGDLVIYPGERISFPFYPPTFQRNISVTISSKDKDLSAQTLTSNLGNVVGASLKARGTRIAAQHVVRSGVKHALVNAAENESETAAALLQVALFLLEEADTRSWQTLPGYLSLLRVALPPGSHSLQLNTNTQEGNGERLDVTINAGQTLYRRVRLQ